jgi:hypothetical protein
VARLERAAAGGGPLHRGERADDVPDGLRRWLVGREVDS